VSSHPTIQPRVRALVFDVDGTLYDRAPVRRAMLERLLWLCVTTPAEAVSTLRVLRAYRRAQEALRRGPQDFFDIAGLQVRTAAAAAHVGEDRVRVCVARWMECEPLSAVARARREGLFELLCVGRRLGLRMGVASDYPAEGKLGALHLAAFFDAIVWAQQPEVQRFKPDPRGLLVALDRLNVAPEEAVYIGDRPDVDAVAAERAGMRCVIVGTRTAGDRHRSFSRSTFAELANTLKREHA
jgi:putative hydrolase of the HAD superfamily